MRCGRRSRGYRRFGNRDFDEDSGPKLPRTALGWIPGDMGWSRQLSTDCSGVVRTVEICHNSRSQYDKLQELPVMNNSTRDRVTCCANRSRTTCGGSDEQHAVDLKRGLNRAPLRTP